MTSLCEAVCRALPKYGKEEIEGVLPLVFAGARLVSLGEAVIGVERILTARAVAVVRQAPRQDRPAVALGEKQDYNARVQAILSKPPKADAMYADRAEYMASRFPHWGVNPEYNK